MVRPDRPDWLLNREFGFYRKKRRIPFHVVTDFFIVSSVKEFTGINWKKKRNIKKRKRDTSFYAVESELSIEQPMNDGTDLP